MAARILSDMVSKMIGQPVVVVNKPGAAHTICANTVANAKPDGYTLGTLSASAFTQVPHYRKVPFDIWKDFYLDRHVHRIYLRAGGEEPTPPGKT